MLFWGGKARNKVFALVGCYTAYIGSYLPTFRDNVWVLPSCVKKSNGPTFKTGNPGSRICMTVSLPDISR
jgi:hypothetical protein